MRRLSRILVTAALVALPLVGPAAARAQTPGRVPADAIDFWSALGDPTLEGLIARAFDSNLGLEAAGARIRAAKAQRLESTLDLVPSITATAGYSRQQFASASFPGAATGLPDHGLWDAGVQISWELDVFGRMRRTVAARNAMIDAAEVDVDDVRVLLAAEVAAAYFDLRGAQDRLAVATRNAENQRNTLQVTLDRLEAGRGTALDSERASAQLSSTLAVIPQLETAVAAASHRIDALLGATPGTTEIEPAASTLDMPPAIPSDLSDTLIRARPDVRSAEHRLEASSALVGAAKAGYLPRLSISGGAGYTAGAFDAIGESGTPRYAVGPVLSWPLFDLGRVKAGVDEARAQEAEASARYRQAILDARQELLTAIVAYERSRDRLGHLENAAAASERATDLARLRYEEGASDFLQVLDAERTQLDAQDRLAQGRSGVTAALVAVYRALGGRWPH
jgi:NodT family efflux transporter outer membrane factor (OMF) lipoprotein